MVKSAGCHVQPDAATSKNRQKCWLSGLVYYRYKGQKKRERQCNAPHHVWCHAGAGASVLHNVCRQAASRCAFLKNPHPSSSAKGRVRHMPRGSKVGTYLFGGRVPGLRPKKEDPRGGTGPREAPIPPFYFRPVKWICLTNNHLSISSSDIRGGGLC